MSGPEDRDWLCLERYGRTRSQILHERYIPVPSVTDRAREARRRGPSHPDQQAAIARTRPDAPVAVCECVLDCSSDPTTACSLTGQWHIHPEWPCLVHPDAPGDRRVA